MTVDIHAILHILSLRLREERCTKRIPVTQSVYTPHTTSLKHTVDPVCFTLCDILFETCCEFEQVSVFFFLAFFQRHITLFILIIFLLTWVKGTLTTYKCLVKYHSSTFSFHFRLVFYSCQKCRCLLKRAS